MSIEQEQSTRVEYAINIFEFRETEGGKPPAIYRVNKRLSLIYDRRMLREIYKYVDGAMLWQLCKIWITASIVYLNAI